MHDRASASTFTHDCHTARISTKSLDMILNPLKTKPLIIQSSIRYTAFLLKIWAREPAKCTKAVVDCYKNKAVIARLDQASWVAVVGFAALDISAAMDPD